MSWTSSRPYPKTPRGFRIDDTVTGRVVASGTVANDAQLQMIAVAPDMYEALKSIVEDHDFCGDDWGDRRDAWIETARAALAKAEGKS